MKTINDKKAFYIYNIFIFILLITFIVFPSKSYSSDSIKVINKKPLKPFSDGIEITQDFKSTNNYDSFDIQFATYGYIYKNGYIYVDLLNEDNNKHCKEKIYATSLTDTGPTTINCKLVKNNNYSLNIKTSNIPKSHKLTVYTTFFDNDDYKLEVNNKEKKDNLVINYYKEKKSYTNIYYIVLLLTLDIFMYPFIFMKAGKKI